MNQDEALVVEKISESGHGLLPRSGWENAVRRRIRSEAAPVALRLVERSERPERPPSRASFLVSGLALAAAFATVFLLVEGQRRDARQADRKATIAMIMGLVELETEMADALVEIDMEEARMDEAFHDLRTALAEEDAVADSDEAMTHGDRDDARDTEGARHEVPQRKRANAHKAKARKAALASCDSSHDPLCGL